MSISLKHFKYLALFICSLLCSCNESHLSVQTHYISHENLASYHVGTPDPRLNNPPIGQQLVISWSVPRAFRDYEDVHLIARIRFYDRSEIEEKIPMTQRRGTAVYSLLNEKYFEKKGILSYKIDLIADGVVLEEWKHQIWTEMIKITHEEQVSQEGQVGQDLDQIDLKDDPDFE